MGRWDTDEDAKFRDNVTAIRESLGEVAEFVKFLRKWTPWIIAAVGVAYPAVGKVIAQLPPLPHP